MVTTITTTRNTEKSGTINLIINSKKQYTLLPAAAKDSGYKKTFVDSQDVINLKYTNDKKYYLNGNLLTDAQLNTVISGNNTSGMSAKDVGGWPQVCHYYDANNYYNYHFACYSGMNISANGTGSNIQKDTTINNTWFSDARASVDSFGIDYTTFVLAMGSFVLLIGTTIVTLATVIGALVAAGATGIAAIAVYVAYNSCNNDLNKAYNYINNM